MDGFMLTRPPTNREVFLYVLYIILMATIYHFTQDTTYDASQKHEYIPNIAQLSLTQRTTNPLARSKLALSVMPVLANNKYSALRGSLLLAEAVQ